MTKRTQEQPEQEIIIVTAELEGFFPKVLAQLITQYWSLPLYSSEQHAALSAKYFKSSHGHWKDYYPASRVRESVNKDDKTYQTADIPNVSWEGVSIQKLGFPKLNLNKLDMPAATIAFVEWLDCALTEAYFQATTFQSAVFNYCRIINSNFYNCKIIDTYFKSTPYGSIKWCIDNGEYQTITGVNFDDSYFKNTKFGNIDFNNTSFKKAQFIETSMFRHCKMGNCDFTDADFSKINSFCELIAVSNIEKVQFTAVNFKGCLIEKIAFNACNFDKANFSNANLFGCDFSSCSLKGANLKGANIIRSSFVRSQLYQADFSEALNVLQAEFKDASAEEKAEGLLDVVREEIANCFMQTTSVHGKKRALKLLGSLCSDEKHAVNSDVLINFIKSGKVIGVDTFSTGIFGQSKSDINKPNSILYRIAKRLTEFDSAKITLSSAEKKILAALQAAKAVTHLHAQAWSSVG